MSVRALLVLLLCWSLALGARIGAQEGTVTLELRVGSSDRGWALVDRGSSDGLLKGDLVTFLPREGGTYTGTIVELEERAARVELQDRAFVPAPGTRGKVLLPAARVERRPAKRVRPAPRRPAGESAPPPGDGASPARGEPVFENQDEAWQEGDPLLARVRPVRPEERGASLHGRSYAILDATRASEDDRSDLFARVGGSLLVENPFGGGGRLQADGEWNYRSVVVPDNDDDHDQELRVDRLSYAWGGTRFAPEGWEVGRFLQGGMVEFGVLDGAEWIARRRNGSSFGASIGFMPEPDPDFQSGSDFQVAAFYRWVADESERLSASAGYQKTFHDGAADRDLVVASLRRLPREGWTFTGTAWIDLYTDGDDQKDTLGLTQLYLTTGQRFEGGSTVDFVFRHQEFPQLDRDEFLPVDDGQLADDHHERLAVTSRLQLGRDTRLLTSLGGWVDEDEGGGDAEFGFLLRDFLFDQGFADIVGFGTKGRFETSLGGRLSTGRYLESGRWAVDYEFSQNRLDGFTSANDDLPQHRLRFSRDHSWNDWDLSWRIEGLLYDDENALTVGLYLQRTHY